MNDKTRKNAVTVVIVAIILVLSVFLVDALNRETDLFKGLDTSKNATLDVTLISTHPNDIVDFKLSDGEFFQSMQLNPMQAYTCHLIKKWHGDSELTINLVCEYSYGDVQKNSQQMVTVSDGENKKIMLHI